jgi:hypothetical protein
MDNVGGFASRNLIMLVGLLVVLLILYSIYSYLYSGSADSSYTQFLRGEVDAKSPIVLNNWKVPTIYTGGDFTFSFWLFVDDWNYRVNAYKFLFALSPTTVSDKTVSPLVGVLTPLQNGMMVRAATVKSGGGPLPGSTSGDSATPDITIESNLKALLNQQTSMSMFQNTSLEAPCDIKEVSLQRWVNVTIVSSGRILDVYMDGKLTRSCVLDNVINVPRGQLKLRLGEDGGFGGQLSSVQMWNQQLTPDVVYGIYQMGPTQNQHNMLTDLFKMFGINVTFLGPNGINIEDPFCHPASVTGSTPVTPHPFPNPYPIINPNVPPYPPSNPQDSATALLARL